MILCVCVYMHHAYINLLKLPHEVGRSKSRDVGQVETLGCARRQLKNGGLREGGGAQSRKLFTFT